MNKLEALVVKLGLASPNNVAQIKTTVNKLQESVKNMNPMELNEFINEMFNKVFKSYLFNRVIFSHPVYKKFIEEGVSIEANREYFDTQLLDSKAYDINKRIPTDLQPVKVLQTVLTTQLRDYFTLPVNMNFARAAFASETAFSQWLEAQFKTLEESFNKKLYEVISSKIVKSVINTVDLTNVNEIDKTLENLNILSDNMAFPSKAYNLGYQAKGTGINLVADSIYDDKTRINATKRENMILFVSPRIKNLIDSRVGSIKYHNQYFDIKKYEVITLDEKIMTDSDVPFMLLVDKNAFKGYFRVNEITSQFWGNNMITDYFHHFWLVFGEIPWANGVKIKLSDTFKA